MISEDIQKLRPYGKEDQFFNSLQNYDKELHAYKDYEANRIVVFSKRKGAWVFEFEIDRQYAETWPEAERRCLKKLPDMDVWRRFGNTKKAGQSYDDWLFEEDQKRREKMQKEADREHMAMLKDNKTYIKHVRENAKAGIFSGNKSVHLERGGVLVDGFKDKKNNNSPKEGEE